MKTIVTYDPAWKKTEPGAAPRWGSPETVEQICSLLSDTGCGPEALPADKNLEEKIALVGRDDETIIYILNRFMPEGILKHRFTSELAEKYNLPYTGASSRGLRTGGDKTLLKQIFNNLGILTPTSYVCTPETLAHKGNAEIKGKMAIVKPMLQYGSQGIYYDSVVPSNDIDSIRRLVSRIWDEFGEPSLVEQYIGGENPKEVSVPIIISHEDAMHKMPIVEMNLSIIRQGQGRILSHEVKEGNIPGEDSLYYESLLEIPSSLTKPEEEFLYSQVAKAAKHIGCRDVARADIRVEDGKFYLLEVNVTPDKSRLTTVFTSFSNLGFSQDHLYMLPPYFAMRRNNMEPPEKLLGLLRPVIGYLDGESKITC